MAPEIRRRLLRRLLASVWPDIVVAGVHLPDVGECHVHRKEGESCAQCDGAHRHEWAHCIVLAKRGHFVGSAYRCRVCGARKCDNSSCRERRHHSGPHLYANGRIVRVGK